ncbi:ATP-dependent RNA helicase [Ciborinia camelliae]|nr:ATP-dependent RNA helicase [Ciborinia camelliae]
MGLPLNVVNVLVITSVTLLLSLIALIFRLWSRKLKKAVLGLNDYAIIAAFLFAIGIVIGFYIISFAGGLGVHIVQVPPKRLVVHLKVFLACQILWAAANFSVKISILHLYTEIFPNTRVRRICYGIGALSGFYLISVIIEAFFFCHPIAYNWNKAIPGGHCSDQSTAFLSAGIINLLIDLSVVILPMPMLLFLHMDWKRKLGVAAMFSLGFLICIITLCRIIWLQHWNLADVTYSSLDICIWSALEPNLGVVNACLPVMQPALRKCFKRNSSRASAEAGSDEQIFTAGNRGNKTYAKTRAFQKLGGVELPMNSLATGENLLAA